MKVPRISAVTAMLTCCCMIHTSTSAEQFPSRVVKFLVPQAAGGATDVFARKLAQMLSERWGQPIIVENQAGAAGLLGTDVVAKSAADGYTLLVTYAGSQAVNPWRRRLPTSLHIMSTAPSAACLPCSGTLEAGKCGPSRSAVPSVLLLRPA